jgi:hypothetical protein
VSKARNPPAPINPFLGKLQPVKALLLALKASFDGKAGAVVSALDGVHSAAAGLLLDKLEKPAVVVADPISLLLDKNLALMTKAGV